MNTAFSNPFENPGRAERPSLFIDPAALATNEEAFSILSRLEPNRGRRRSAWRIVWTTPLLSLAAVAVIVGLNGGFEKNALAEGGVAGSPAGAESIQEAVAGALVTPAAPTAPEEGAAVAGEAFLTAEATHGDELASFIAKAEHRTPDEQTGTGAIFAVAAASGAVVGLDNAGKTETSFAAGQTKARATRPKHATAIRAKTHARGATKDKDVALISALLAHVSPSAAVLAPKPPARKQQAVPAAPTRAAARQSRGTSHEQDLARQATGASTESQVRQCRSLGILEGELCRLRACSGLWGKDPACPSSALTASDS